MKPLKSFATLTLCLLLALTACFSAGAYDTATEAETTTTQITTEDGSVITVIDELIVQDLSRSSSKTVTRKRTFVKGDTTIGVIALTAEFSYTGSSVSVVSKRVSQSTTYNGWKFTQNSLTSSGGTASLSGKLTKFLNAQVPVEISITCDTNGNIT